MTGTAANRIQFNRKLSTAGKKKKKKKVITLEITTGCGDVRKTAKICDFCRRRDVFRKGFIMSEQLFRNSASVLHLLALS